MIATNLIPVGVVNAKPSARYVCLEDYSDRNYKAMRLMEDAKGNPVVICHSISGTPDRYRVIHGRTVGFFLSYSEVLDYCTKHKCKLIDGGNR